MDDSPEPASAETPSLWLMKATIERMGTREDRAMLRAWMLATYDEQGDSRVMNPHPPTS